MKTKQPSAQLCAPDADLTGQTPKSSVAGKRCSFRAIALAVLAAASSTTVCARPLDQFPAFIAMPGLSAEGVVVDQKGNVLVTIRDGGQGKVWTYSQCGDPSLVTTINGPMIGGLAISANDDLYAAMAGGANRGVYQIGRAGSTNRLSGTAEMVFANALAFDHRGTLYVTESYSREGEAYGPGGIWRVRPDAPAEVWLRHGREDGSHRSLVVECPDRRGGELLALWNEGKTMNTRNTLVAARMAVGLAALSTLHTLTACPDGLRVRLTGTDSPTGEIFDPGNMIGLLPDADGIIRARGVVVGAIQTFKMPKLGTPDLVLHVKATSNFNFDTTAGFNGMTWCFWNGYVTDAGGNQMLVVQGFGYGFRKKVSEAKWVEEATIVGLFCNGPLAGAVMNATEIVESADPTMAAGYTGIIKGELIVPDSVPLRSHAR